MSKVLIVEDEKHLAEGLRFNLEAEGYQVEIVADGEAAQKRLLSRTADFEVVILDIMLPGKDGFDVASELRQAGQYVPILMLTARSRPDDILKGFEAGADDYISKPFELKILLARLKGLLRRRGWFHLQSQTQPQENEFRFSGKIIDFNKLEIRVHDRVVKLTLMEGDLLRYFIKHADQPISRKAILEEVWGLRDDTDTRAIDNFIVRLRKYIEDDPAAPLHLQTVRGVGYKFVPMPI